MHNESAEIVTTTPVSPDAGRATTSTSQNDREELIKRAKFLARVGLAWHFAEAAIAIAAGIAASSIALIGFGADSVVEAFAGVILLWRFGASRSGSTESEHRAQKLIAVSFFVIAAYVGVEAIRSLVTGEHVEVSWVGIVLAAVTTVTMPPLARAKQRVAEKLNSGATRSEGRQTMLCAYMSVALLFGLGANAIAGLWWVDALVALFIAAIAVDEGIDSWRGEDLCCS